MCATVRANCGRGWWLGVGRARSAPGQTSTHARSFTSIQASVLIAITRHECLSLAVDGSESLGEATGVVAFGTCERLEPLGDLLEALVAGGLGEAGVHLGVLVGLALDRGLEVVGGGADGDAGHRVADLGEKIEVAERVARLALRDRTEQRGDVCLTFDVGPSGEVEVAAVGLAFAAKCLFEVLVGFGAVQIGHRGDLPYRRVGASASRRSCESR